MRRTTVALALLILVGCEPTLTVDERLDHVRCEQYGGRFADPCPTATGQYIRRSK